MKGAAERKVRIEVRLQRNGQNAGFIERVLRQGNGGKLVVTYGGAIYDVHFDGEVHYIYI